MPLVTITELPPAGQPLFVDFVNTLHWYEGVPIELLGSDADLAAWAAEQHLPSGDLTGALPALCALREDLRAGIVALVAREPWPAAAASALDAALRGLDGHLVLVEAATPATRPRLAFETAAAGGPLLAWRVALSLATFLESGPRHRLKLCANPGCGFAFVDTSINGTRRWCDMRYCGNRLKARGFRRRRTLARVER
jgi:predicted RNA-binding Zn ribbon-like protein